MCSRSWERAKRAMKSASRGRVAFLVHLAQCPSLASPACTLNVGRVQPSMLSGPLQVSSTDVGVQVLLTKTHASVYYGGRAPRAVSIPDDGCEQLQRYLALVQHCLCGRTGGAVPWPCSWPFVRDVLRLEGPIVTGFASKCDKLLMNFQQRIRNSLLLLRTNAHAR